jgi:hypothetical protein
MFGKQIHVLLSREQDNIGKLGVERMDGKSAVHEKNIVLFDLVPCRKEVKTYHYSSLPTCDKT